jgi:putative sterol carrier protein
VTREGEGPTPRLTITVDAAEFLRIAAGTSNPVNAYFNGKLSLRGDLMQAARLTMLFRIPSPPRKPAGQGP